MKREDRLHKKPEPALQGFRVGGGLRNLPHNFGLDLRRNKALYLFLTVIHTDFILFHYLPMFGILMSFEKFSPVKGILGSKWIGFDNFIVFFSGPYAGRLIKNTALIGVLDLLINFPAPIIFALLLNEIRQNHFKKTVQTISYMPYFVSTVVAASLVINFTKSGGAISESLKFMTGGSSENLLNLPSWFKPIYILMGTWQGMGYGSIIYLAALSNVDQELYDAAKVDGAGYWKQMWHITLPGISAMIVMMFIMRMGTVFSVGADKILLLYNPSTYDTADVINTYVYRIGMQDMNFGLSTAVGLFNSVIGTILLLTSNSVLKKLSGTSMF